MDQVHNVALPDGNMALLLKQCGTELSAISQFDAALKRVLYAGLTLYRGDQMFAVSYDHILLNLMTKRRFHTTVADIMPIRDGIKHNPQDWPFCLTDTEFRVSCNQLYGGSIPEVRWNHHQENVRMALARDIMAVLVGAGVGVVVGLTAATIRGSAMTAATAMGRMTEGVAQSAGTTAIGTAVGSIALKTPEAIHKNQVWDRYNWETERRALST
jgi:hypothetical protein